MEVRGETSQDVTVIDDYGHHPTEIKATLEAARTRYPDRRIWAVWQPHTFSRTQALMNEFVQSFTAADHVLVTEVYAARESDPDFSAAQVVEKIQQPAANFCPTFRDAIALLNAHLVPGDVLIVLSAGDADQISAAVLAELRKKEQAHGRKKSKSPRWQRYHRKGNAVSSRQRRCQCHERRKSCTANQHSGRP
jgi:UDP-N-acetylmuramate--alanine ligase